MILCGIREFRPRTNPATTNPKPQEMTMRYIETHKVNPANDKIDILVNDQPGAGGANHRYELTGFDTAGNASAEDPAGYKASFSKQVILFQNGPIPESGVNGVTQEVLLAIVADRLRSFQAGPFANDYNAAALAHVESAMGVLLDRTRDRMKRGVEGKHAA